MKKYPRTFHLPFSPGLQNDDRRCNPQDLIDLIEAGAEFVITEKLDGGNCCMKPDGVFARSHAAPTGCPTFNYVKNVHYFANLPLIQSDNLAVFGENVFAIHSVEYTALTDYFYLFGIMEMDTETFVEWDMLMAYAEEMRMPVAPIVYEGKIESVEWLEKFINDQMKSESALGGEKEGFVIRVRDSFTADEFESKVFKYVREGHVQSGEHWRKNWKQAQLKGA